MLGVDYVTPARDDTLGWRLAPEGRVDRISSSG